MFFYSMSGPTGGTFKIISKMLANQDSFKQSLGTKYNVNFHYDSDMLILEYDFRAMKIIHRKLICM